MDKHTNLFGRKDYIFKWLSQYCWICIYLFLFKEVGHLNYSGWKHTNSSAALMLTIASRLCYVITVIKTSLTLSKFPYSVLFLNEPSIIHIWQKIIPSICWKHGFIGFTSLLSCKEQFAVVSVALAWLTHMILPPIH